VDNTGDNPSETGDFPVDDSGMSVVTVSASEKPAIPTWIWIALVAGAIYWWSESDG